MVLVVNRTAALRLNNPRFQSAYARQSPSLVWIYWGIEFHPGESSGIQSCPSITLKIYDCTFWWRLTSVGERSLLNLSQTHISAWRSCLLVTVASFMINASSSFELSSFKPFNLSNSTLLDVFPLHSWDSSGRIQSQPTMAKM